MNEGNTGSTSVRQCPMSHDLVTARKAASTEVWIYFPSQCSRIARPAMIGEKLARRSAGTVCEKPRVGPRGVFIGKSNALRFVLAFPMAFDPDIAAIPQDPMT